MSGDTKSEDIAGNGPSGGGETDDAAAHDGTASTTATTTATTTEAPEIEVVGPEPAVPAGARLPHQPALDGLRGLAVAAVVVYHGAAADGIAWLQSVTRGGFLGVSAFFTLSGFLICSLLLREREQAGTISLRGFWERRARRLLPAAYLVIGAVVVLTPLVGTQSQLDQLPGDVWASLLYVANWRFILEGADYAQQFAGAPSPLKHLWSLSVEEQWYLLVPLVALLVVRVGVVRVSRAGVARRRALGRALGVSVVLGTGWMVLQSGGHWDNAAYMGTGTRLAEMAVGALAAVLLTRDLQVPAHLRRPVTMAAPLALAALLALWAFTPLEAPWLYRGGLTVHAALVALVIVAAVQGSGPARAVLSLRLLARLGRISYGVYLIHWPVLWWLTPDRVGWGPTPTLALQVALTLGLAALSFRLLEAPIRHGGALRGRRALLVPLGAAAAIAVGVALLPAADHSQLSALGTAPELVVPTTPPTTAVAPAAAPGAAPAVPVTTAPPPPPPLRVMVVGDSFAESVVTGLQRWALLSGKAAVMNQTIVGCPFGRGGSNRGINITRQAPPACAERDARLLHAVADFDPEVVLLAGGLWDVTERKPTGFRRWTHIGDPTYDEYLAVELAHMAEIVASGGAKVVWANSPYWNPVPNSVIFMGKPPYAESDTQRVDRFNQLLADTAATHPGLAILDLAGWMRAQPGGEFDRSLRFDGVHFTDESTNTLAQWLGPQLLGAAGR